MNLNNEEIIIVSCVDNDDDEQGQPVFQDKGKCIDIFMYIFM